ncbi:MULTISPECIES: cupin-like domain-containing protein [unclassified Myxococcus]|uniref:cupin-like domain-containing protein n=1 Tax=unclassified Myxococcus TaxID=2648731 RepID=UPI001CC18299|nr:MULTISPECIES: cupin-like domain-containing protein [unclassified Myxococcus]MBZ4397867.1 cupin-like domain-containing protein [Myxococcus sp. AS-1-15]MBZ4407569.1 cupin-like domain-containing protein [Myxococcus sp. XM-1-1-1]
MSVDTSRLALEWQVWLVENLAMGVTREEACLALAGAGVSEEVAREEVARVEAHPFFQACQRVGRRYGWLESVMDTYSTLHRQSGGHLALERRHELSAEEFFTRYYFGHRPVVLTGRMKDWPALGRWSLSYLAERVGDVEVEVMTRRESNPDHAPEPDKHRETMRFRDYVHRVATGGETNDYYMVPRNENWQREGFEPLREDVRAPQGIIDDSLRPDMMTLLLGPAGTVTPLHHDNMNVLLAQVMGRKHVKLIPSFQRHLMYPRYGTFSHVDAERPDVERHPLYAEAHVVEAVLEPGELVFIPVGWWHWVRALDVSASVTFHHFQVPQGNTYLPTPL